MHLQHIHLYVEFKIETLSVNFEGREETQDMIGNQGDKHSVCFQQQVFPACISSMNLYLQWVHSKYFRSPNI